jgi:aldose 1-epimerase
MDAVPGGPSDAEAGAPFGVLPDGSTATLFTLATDGITLRVTDWGATIVALEVPDRDGVTGGVVLGLDDATGYADTTPGRNPYLGASVGRVANRIAGAAFELDGERFELVANEGANSLHGGRRDSFDRARWELVACDGARLVLRHVSPDGAAGYPGTLTVEATFALTPSMLTLTYVATTDRRTPVNLTQHAYFNLAGEAGVSVLDHTLAVDATALTPVDAELIPTGEVRDVTGTPFDLRLPRRLGDGVDALVSEGWGDGYDHNLWLAGAAGEVRDVAVLHDPASGRRMTLATDQPCLQVYSGNRLGRTVGRGGVTFPRHGALCLEPQHAPDSVHRPDWPSIILAPGERYQHRTVYRFDTA